MLWGDHYAAVDTAAFLANVGKQVTIVTENRELGAEVEVIHMYVARKRFAQGDAEVLESRPYPYPVKVITGTTVEEIRDGEVVLRDKDFKLTTLPADEIVTCHIRDPRRAFFEELRGSRCERHQRWRFGLARGTSITRSVKARRSAWRSTSSSCSTPTARSSTICRSTSWAS